jgi:hypothetical protein
MPDFGKIVKTGKVRGNPLFAPDTRDSADLQLHDAATQARLIDVSVNLPSASTCRQRQPAVSVNGSRSRERPSPGSGDITGLLRYTKVPFQ